LKDQIVAHVKKNHTKLRVHFIEQPVCNGTAKAVELALSHLGKAKFVVINSDDIHSKSAIAKTCTFPLAMLAHESAHAERFGVIDLHPNGTMKNVIEKPERPATNLVNVGVHVLDYRVFNYPMRQHTNGEYYLTDLIDQLCRDEAVAVVRSDLWIPIGYPEDLQSAEAILDTKKRV
jgi:dTDP-glucose pyrophosphorylase